MSCEKHPNNVRGASPEELAEEFAYTTYSYHKGFFDELWKKYLEQSKGDKERPSLKNPNKNRTQLSSNLEELSKAIKGPLKYIRKICEICKPYMKTNNSSQ